MLRWSTALGILAAPLLLRGLLSERGLVLLCALLAEGPAILARVARELLLAPPAFVAVSHDHSAAPRAPGALPGAAQATCPVARRAEPPPHASHETTSKARKRGPLDLLADRQES